MIFRTTSGNQKGEIVEGHLRQHRFDRHYPNLPYGAS